MQKKSLAAILAALMLAVSLSSCGSRDNGGSSSGSGPSEGVSDLESGVGDAVSDLGSAIGDGISDIGEGASELVSDIGEGASELISDIGEGVSDVVSDMGEGVSDLTDGNHKSSEVSGKNDQTARLSSLDGENSAVETVAKAGTTDLSSLSNQKQGWGQGVQVDENNRPLSPITFQEKYGKYDAYFIGEDEKVLYLTFDEGYENGYTPQILDTLKEKQVPAVFFVTLDYVKSQPELIQRMIDEGHVIGNHSDKHPSFPDVSAQRCEQEIRNVDQYLADQFGYTGMNLFRPPAGEFSERVLAQVQSLGYKTIFWSYAYKDWDPNNQMGADKALEKVNGALHNGAIYLLHAVSKDNAEILGNFIDEARSQGYEFKTL